MKFDKYDRYFRTKVDRVIFALLYTEGEVQKDILEIHHRLYSNTALAKAWYDDMSILISLSNNILATIKLEELYSNMK